VSIDRGLLQRALAPGVLWTVVWLQWFCVDRCLGTRDSLGPLSGGPGILLDRCLEDQRAWNADSPLLVQTRRGIGNNQGSTITPNPALCSRFTLHAVTKGHTLQNTNNTNDAHSSTKSTANVQSPFQFNLMKVSDIKASGEADTVPFLVESLLPRGGLSVLAAKPKQGKSSFARYLAVCVAKGEPCISLPTEKGDVLLISLEDPRSHVVNCLDGLGYDEQKDGLIEIVNKLSVNTTDNFQALEDALSARPNVALVIIDHLTKFLRVGDIMDYDKMQAGFMKVRQIADKFANVHILSLVHCKKVQQSDPFDGILGSTSLRGEPDTNIVIFQAEGSNQRLLTAETRIGKFIPPSVLHSELVEIKKSDVIKSFALGGVYDEMKAAQAEKKETKKKKDTIESRIVAYLQSCKNHTAKRTAIMDAENVKGKAEDKAEVLTILQKAGAIEIIEGKGKGKPLTVKLKKGSVGSDLYLLGKKKAVNEVIEESESGEVA
jgi:hypothetical protein